MEWRRRFRQQARSSIEPGLRKKTGWFGWTDRERSWKLSVSRKQSFETQAFPRTGSEWQPMAQMQMVASTFGSTTRAGRRSESHRNLLTGGTRYGRPAETESHSTRAVESMFNNSNRVPKPRRYYPW